MVKVCKFGGTSMATAKSILQIKSIIEADSERRYVVVSAPGKRFKTDEKVTDLLYACFDESRSGSCSAVFAKIIARYDEIIKDLGLSLNLSADYAVIESTINNSHTADYAASRGEYLGAKIAAAALGYTFIDAADIVKFNDDGSFNEDVTNRVAGEVLSKVERAVIAGFYGAKRSGDIKTFSRGGSDVSGAIVARAVNATVYENWTDVSGFMAADPRIVDNPRKISYLSYRELRELSYMGANVLHSDSIFPVKIAGIPINIRNTFAPEDEGTFIVPNVDNYEMPLVTGVAGTKGFVSVTIEKSNMNNEVGFIRRVLSIIEHYNISVEHLPSGIDTLTLIFKENEVKHALNSLLNEIERIIAPEHVEMQSGIALIATVGHGMAYRIGTAARLFNTLSDEGVNIRMIDQGSSEMNIIIGVLEQDYERAIKAIYRELVEREDLSK